jgi:hypothetical protein
MNFMKRLLFLAGLLCQLFCEGQTAEIFQGIDFDSSYTVIGLGQGHPDNSDSLPQFWFVLDNPNDMEKIKQDWNMKKAVRTIGLEDKFIEIMVVRNKQLVNPGTLIFPRQGVIKSGNAWYRFDTVDLVKLHRDHPLKFHSQDTVFDTYAHFAAYGNSMLNDSTVLLFLPPSMQYEGKFIVTADRTADPASQMWAVGDVEKELKELTPVKTYRVSFVSNDTFNLAHRDKVKVVVECPKSLYDKYQSKSNNKGPWQPTLIDVKIFRRD